jgi:hypothetical protein
MLKNANIIEMRAYFKNKFQCKNSSGQTSFSNIQADRSNFQNIHIMEALEPCQQYGW